MSTSNHNAESTPTMMARGEVSIVYLWCDMSDPQWNANRNAVAEEWKEEVKYTDEEAVGRYQSHDELRYSLRSMEMHAPWVSDVFIVVSDDNALPSWLNTDNPRLHIVRHSEIIPKQFLPTYNSVTIEHFISRIPGLSEKFLYSNDDMFFFGDVAPDFFFDEHDEPLRRVCQERLNVLPQDYYYDTIRNSLKIVRDANKELQEDVIHSLGFLPFHNIDAYRKSHHLATYNKYKMEIEASLVCPFRKPTDIQRALYLMEEVASYGAKTVCDTNDPPFSMCLDGTTSWRKGLDNTLRLRPKLLCINAWHDNTPDDFEWLRLAMDVLFPVPSSFEK